MSIHPSFPYQLYLVISETDCCGKNLFDVAEKAIAGGVDIIQLREKNSTPRDFLKKALQLKTILDRYHVPLIINDDASVAEQVNAAGVHVGNTDELPSRIRRRKTFNNKMIGYSLECLSQVTNEQSSIADYLGISPVFKTDTKKNTVTEWGFSGIADIRKLTNKPLVAIGGIGVQHVRSIMNAGAHCIAVVSAICRAHNPLDATRQLKHEIVNSGN